jgi:glycosyltransferase involved in cell wall biosynthesis
MPRQRVLAFVGGTYVFGAEIAALDMLSELARRGHHIHCVVSGWNDGDMIRRLERLGWPYTVAKLGFFYLKRPDWTIDSLVHYPGARLTVQRALRQVAPDVVYFLGSNGLLMLPWFSARTKTVVHIVDAVAPTARTRVEFRILAGRAHRFIAISRSTARSLEAQGVPRDRVRVVYPPVTLEPAGRLSAPSLPAAPRIGIVGQLIPRKGHADLFAAAAELANRGLDFTLHVFGRGPADVTAALEAQVRRLGLASRTNFHGYVGDRSEIYRQLDIVVVPTRDHEALGLVAAEPGTQGLPVVASAIGGLPEVVLDGETGLLFRAGDAGDLAGKLGRLLTEPGLAPRLGAAAADHITRTFGRQPSGDAFERVLQELQP